MKKRLSGLLVLIMVFPVFADKDENVVRDYIKCLVENKTPEARIKCLEGYLQTYPDTRKKFTRLAYCILALNHFDTKNYAKTVEIGENSLKIGGMDDGIRAKLLLAMGSAYGTSSSAVYNKNKARTYADQAMELAEKVGLEELAQKARRLKTRLIPPPTPLKTRLNAPPKHRMTPVQKFKKLISQGLFCEAIAQYKKLPDTVKNNPDIRELYAKALLESGQLEAALKEFNRLYTENKKAKYARRISEVYEKKAIHNRTFYKNSSSYLIEASMLYRIEGDQSNADAAIKKAKYNYYELYNLHKRIDDYIKKSKQKSLSEQENDQKIRRIRHMIRKEKRRLEKLYPDIDPPAYELKPLNKLKKDLELINSGPKPADAEDKEEAEILAQMEKVDKEFDALVAQVKSRI